MQNYLLTLAAAVAICKSMMPSAHVPHQPDLIPREYRPRILMLAGAVAVASYLMTRPVALKLVETGGAKVCQSRYCQVGTEMFVDSCKNTLLKDQSMGTGLQRPQKLPGPAEVQANIQNDLTREQLLSPGLRLVAHAVV